MALEDEAFVSYGDKVPPLCGSRHWYDLSYEEQDQYFLSCFKGATAREKEAEKLGLFDRIALSIAHDLLGDKFYEFQPKNESDVQTLAACRLKDLEDTLLGQKLLCVLVRDDLRNKGKRLGTHSAEGDPMLFFEFLDSQRTRGFEYLSPMCTTSFEETEKEAQEEFNKLGFVEQQQQLKEIEEDGRKILGAPKEQAPVFVTLKQQSAMRTLSRWQCIKEKNGATWQESREVVEGWWSYWKTDSKIPFTLLATVALCLVGGIYRILDNGSFWSGVEDAFYAAICVAVAAPAFLVIYCLGSCIRTFAIVVFAKR